jgi:hypothetical protein
MADDASQDSASAATHWLTEPTMLKRLRGLCGPSDS